MSAPNFPQEQQQYAAPTGAPIPQQQPQYAAPAVQHQQQPIVGGQPDHSLAPAAAPATNGNYTNGDHATTNGAHVNGNGAATTTTAAHNGATPVKSGPVDHNDIELWKQKFNTALADPAATIKSKSATDAREWDASFCGCCNPIDVCCMTYCCPCVTFGKTHHRLNKSSTMQGYEPINTSCLMFFGAGCFGLHWVLEALQRSQIRAKYNLKGSFLGDLGAACCCILCDLTQQEKETKFRETAGGSGAAGAAAAVAPEQYKAAEAGMAYEHKA